jgi:hypothetical protein
VTEDRQNAIEIALAEYAYWKRVADEDDASGADPNDMSHICIGALGASANIVGALLGYKSCEKLGVDMEAALAANKLIADVFSKVSEHEKEHADRKQRIRQSIKNGARMTRGLHVPKVSE